MSSPASVVSLGCRMNIAEGETIRGLLGNRDTVVVNSCAVTANAVTQSRAAVRRMRRAHPEAELVVTGCAACDLAPLADRIVDNASKLAPASWDAAGRPPIATSLERARAFVGVQDGCEHDCTFCVTTQARGSSRSVALDAVVDHVTGLNARGHGEVVLSGIDLSGYGSDLEPAKTLAELIEALLVRTSLPRLRLSSLDVGEIDERLTDLLVGEARVMPHLHLSLQSGDDLILKRMKRRHTRRQAIEIVSRLKAGRDIAIGADLIAGFPTESDTAFTNTQALLDDCDIVHAHVFPYSPRPGTAAARMPQLPIALRRDRATKLRTVAATRKASWLARLVGSRYDVLIEKPGDRGHAGNFAEVRLAEGSTVGSIRPVRITAAADDHLIGTPA